VPETASCGSAGSDSLYDMSLEVHQQNSIPNPEDDSPFSKSKLDELDFEKVPNSLESDMLVDPDDDSNVSSTFNLVISDESNDEVGTSDSCPVSPDANLEDSSSESSFSVSKKSLPQQQEGQISKVNTSNHLIDNGLKSLPNTSNTEIKTSLYASHVTRSLDSPHLDTAAEKPKRKPVTLPRRKSDIVISSAGNPSTCMYSGTDDAFRKHPKITPRRSNSEQAFAPNITFHKADKVKPPVIPRRTSSTKLKDGDTSRSPPIPKPRVKKRKVRTVPATKSSSNEGSPELHTATTNAVTHLSTFKNDFCSLSAQNSPVTTRKVFCDEINFKKQLLRPLSSYTDAIASPMNSRTQILPKSASNDELKDVKDPSVLPSAAPAIEMAPFEEDWQERFMQHKRRSKTLGKMRIRSQLIEVKGTKSQTI